MLSYQLNWGEGQHELLFWWQDGLYITLYQLWICIFNVFRTGVVCSTCNINTGKMKAQSKLHQFYRSLFCMEGVNFVMQRPV